MADEIKWYQKSGWILLSLILFFPLGLVLMWKYANWNQGFKIIITGFFGYLLIMMNSTPSGTSITSASPSPTPEPITEEYKNSLAKTFCDERSKPYTRAVNFSDFITMTEKAPEIITLHPANGKYPTQDNCKKVTDICLNLWSKEKCQDIAEMKVWIGQDSNQLILSWGLPDDRNNTVGSWGVHSQWVYGTGEYVYLEGKTQSDLVVTSWQN